MTESGTERLIFLPSIFCLISPCYDRPLRSRFFWRWSFLSAFDRRNLPTRDGESRVHGFTYRRLSLACASGCCTSPPFVRSAACLSFPLSRGASDVRSVGRTGGAL